MKNLSELKEADDQMKIGQMNNNKYTPINCSYYDELEAIATLQKSVEISYYDNEAPSTLENVQIKDLYTKNKEEFVVLSNGLTLRLDYLISVDGKAVVYGC